VADLGLGGHVRKAFRFSLDLDVEFVTQSPEHRLEVGIVGVLGPEVLG
jgi:hypothetical protein